MSGLLNSPLNTNKEEYTLIRHTRVPFFLFAHPSALPKGMATTIVSVHREEPSAINANTVLLESKYSTTNIV